MRMAIVAMVAASALVGLPALPALASGGGGCGAPTTEGTGDSVAITGFCFEPTVLYTDPGTSVTFENTDPVRHNVLGANAGWGSFETLREGRSAVNSFDEPGVYPYVCSWHPGMVGAVVVGEPGGLATEPVVRVIDRDTARGPWKAVAAISLGLLLLTLVAAAGRRKTET